MAIKFIIIVLNFLILRKSFAYHIEGRIAYGQNAIPKSAPYIVSLQVETLSGKYHHSCGGAIINKNWIITAGHCVSDPKTISKHIICAGRHNITADESTEQRRKIDWYKIHENYDIETGVAPNDIALIFVKEPFVWTDAVQPISLPKSEETHSGIGKLFGWGLLNSHTADFPDILQTGNIPIISNDECIEKIHHIPDKSKLKSSNICTLSVDGISACSSDSGGPLVQTKLTSSTPQNELVGVVSWGPPCGSLKGKSISVYVRVSSFIKWIEKVTKEYSLSKLINIFP